MQPDAQGKYPYTGSMDCALKTLKSGGPFKFYTGFPVYCVRIAPHVMVLILPPPSFPPCICLPIFHDFVCLAMADYLTVFRSPHRVLIAECFAYADDLDIP